MTASQEAYVRELLSEVYLPEGVDIWLASTHRSGPLTGQCPNDMLAAGQGASVLAAVEMLVGGGW